MALREVEPAPSERVAEINGSELHYWVYREELLEPRPDADEDVPPPVVMVHGLRGTHEGLQLIVDLLPDRCVVVPDLPGFGESTPMAGKRHDVAGYATAVVALLELLDARSRPAFLLGHSFGSVIVARAASSAPELVRRLVLVSPIATPPLNGPRVVLTGLTSAYYAIGKALPPRWGNALLSNKLAVLVASQAMLRSKDKKVRQFVYDSHLRHFSRFHSPGLLNETYEASVSRTVADYAEGLTMPTLLIAGESDEIAPLEGQRRLRAVLPRGELVVIPDVGHLVHYETPDAAAAEIERFVAAQDESGNA